MSRRVSWEGSYLAKIEVVIPRNGPVTIEETHTHLYRTNTPPGYEFVNRVRRVQSVTDPIYKRTFNEQQPA